MAAARVVSRISVIPIQSFTVLYFVLERQFDCASLITALLLICVINLLNG